MLTFAAYENLPTKTYSSPHAFPSALRSKRALVQNTMTGDEAAVDRDPVVSSERSGAQRCSDITMEFAAAWLRMDYVVMTFSLTAGSREVPGVWTYRSLLQGDAAAFGRRGFDHFLQGELWP